LLYFKTILSQNTSSGIKHIFPTMLPGFKYFIVGMFKFRTSFLAVFKAKNKYIYANSLAQLVLEGLWYRF